MTLAATLPQKLSEWRPAGDGRHSLTHSPPDGPWAVHISADRVDSVGCLLWEVTLTRGPADGGAPGLAGWAASVAAAKTGLLEPLRVVEVDAPRQEAILRSESPAQRGDEVLYYELHLHGRDRAVLSRFKAAPKQNGRREQVPFALTHEALSLTVEGIARF